MHRLLLLLSLFFISEVVQSQIVNIEESRMKDKTGFQGGIDLSLSFTRNTQEVVQFHNQINLKHQQGKNIHLLLSDFDIIRSGENELINNGFQHLRYNRILGKRVVWEVFGQSQYNRIQQIDIRLLAGTGPRFVLANFDSLRVFFGVTPMFEYERLTSGGGINRSVRLSNYLSVSWKANDYLSIYAVSYYQPSTANFDDYRLSTEISVVMSITDRLATTITYDLLDDTRVPEGVPRTIYSIKNGISYQF